MAVFPGAGPRESEAASWVGNPGIFLVNGIMKENAGERRLVQKAERGTDRREGHTAICKNQTFPKPGRHATVGWLAGWLATSFEAPNWWPAGGTGSQFKKRKEKRKRIVVVEKALLSVFFFFRCKWNCVKQVITIKGNLHFILI